MRITTKPRGRLATAGTGVALTLALVLTGCGGSSPSAPAAAPTPTTAKASPAKVLLASARTTASAGSARLAMTMSTSGSDEAAIALEANGISDFATGDSQITMHLGGAMAALFDEDLEVRAVDSVAYVRLPGSLGGLFGGGKSWVAIDASEFGDAQSATIPGLSETDPTQFLAYLQTVSSDAKKVGTEAVRGVETTRYHASFDLGKAVDQSGVPAELRDALRKLLAKNGAAAPTIPSDIWIDDAGRVRRLTMQLDLASFAGLAGATGEIGPDASMTMSIELYDFGVPVNVQAPPADDVTRLSKDGLLGMTAPGLPTQ